MILDTDFLNNFFYYYFTMVHTIIPVIVNNQILNTFCFNFYEKNPHHFLILFYTYRLMFTWAIGALEWDTAEYSPLFIWTSPKIFTTNRFRCDMFFFRYLFSRFIFFKNIVVLDWRQVTNKKKMKKPQRIEHFEFQQI